MNTKTSNMRVHQIAVLVTCVQMYITIAQCFITRLDDCKYSANFTRIYVGKYFQGTVGTTKVGPIKRDECSALCLGDKSCVFYNHKLDNTACELMTSHIGDLIDKSGWQHATTDYANYLYRGPLCEFLQIDCSGNSVKTQKACFDTCETPGYKCKTISPIPRAKLKVIRGTKTKASRPYSLLFDGDIDTYYATEAESNKMYMIINMGKQYAVYNVRIFNRIDNPKEKKFLAIKVSRTDNNDYKTCTSNVKLKNNEKFVDAPCKESGSIAGKFMKISKEDTGARYTAFGEIYIYGFDQ